jgi:HD-GYP domain-containing protein (c-di-GMP phosphodiesterase class II)/HAMP domain-containing protein
MNGIQSAIARPLTRISLRKQTLLFTILALLAVAGLFYVIGLKAVQRVTQDALQMRLELARETAGHLNREIEKVSSSLQHAAAVSGLDLDQVDMERMNRTLELAASEVGPLAQQFLLLDSQGRLLLSKGEVLLPLDTDLTAYDSVITALSRGAAQTSSLHQIEGKPVIWVVSPLQKEERLTGAILAVMDLSQPDILDEVLGALSGSPYAVEVVDDAGMVLASSRAENLFQSADHGDILASLVREKREAVRECHSCHLAAGEAERRNDMLAVAPLEQAPWVVTLRQPEVEVFAAAKDLKRNFLLGGAAALVVIVTMVVLANGVTIQRLRLLSAAARSIAQGDLSFPVPCSGRDEIASLARDLDEMRVSLRDSQKELEQRIKKRTAELSTLYEIDRLVVQTLPQEEFLRRSLSLMTEVLEADAGGIYLRGRGGNLTLKVHWGVSPQFAAAVRYVRFGEGITSRAIELSRPLAMDLSHYTWPTERLARYAAEEGLRHVASAPLLLEGEASGGIVVVRRREQPFTAEELELLEAVGNQLAVSLERNRLLWELETRVGREAALARITRALSTSLELEEIYHILAAELQRMVEFDFISVSLLAATEAIIERVFIFPTPAPQGMEPGRKYDLKECASGAVVSSGSPLLRHDLEQEKAFPLDEALLRAGIRSTLVLPLSVRGKVLGTLNLGSSRVGAYSEADVRFLQLIAEELALAIDHARLYQEARHSAELNAVLHSSSVTLSALLEEQNILEELVNLVLRETRADQASVLLPDESRQIFQLAAVASRNEKLRQAIQREHRRAPLRVNEGVSGRVFTSGEPLLVDDYTRFPGMLPRFAEAGIRSIACVPLRVRAQILGVLDVLSTEPGRHTPEDLFLLQTIAGHGASALLNARLYRWEREARENLQTLAQELEKSTRELRQAYETMAASLVDLLETRDPYTRGHSDRVRHYCRQIARFLGLSSQQMVILDQAAQLHDLGKIGIPDSILHKPEVPSPPEWAKIRLHPEKTVELLRHFPFLEPAFPLIRSHHERWDGKGYPDNLAGEKIPLGARILAAADAYDAMTTDRPYRRALTHARAVEELKRGAGTQWDPTVVDTLLQVLAEEQPPDYHR